MLRPVENVRESREQIEFCTFEEPEEPSNEEFSFRNDLRAFGPMLLDDARAVANWDNALTLGVAAAAAVGMRQDWDEQVRGYTAEHPERWGDASETIGRFGFIDVQAPVLLGAYGYSVWSQDAELHDVSTTLLSAVTITGVSTVLVKAAANTDRPSDDFNGGQFGFPSYHTASSFAIASVLDEYYGATAGLPAYAFAGLIGWSRIDERDHDLSDVFFGAALGYVIGASVARKHLSDDPRVRIFPYAHPTEGSSGLMLEWMY